MKITDSLAPKNAQDFFTSKTQICIIASTIYANIASKYFVVNDANSQL
jgi:hypothetical protein